MNIVIAKIKRWLTVVRVNDAPYLVPRAIADLLEVALKSGAAHSAREQFTLQVIKFPSSQGRPPVCEWQP